ncbi:hypothetical protein [Geoglobus acetivorans]|uniref:Uncharacterized protein n=1 Tax=Geoglobus acetivorans TaxID=565033 RepID=A0A0A7GDL1_GEOAI|nr:hypothetical protein GACE_0865 [Geoglobus acetivorans]
MEEEQTVIIEGEEFVRVSIPLPKRFVEFLREYGKWVGYEEDETDKFIGEAITESIESYIQSKLDDMLLLAPVKVQKFRKKFNL